MIIRHSVCKPEAALIRTSDQLHLDQRLVALELEVIKSYLRHSGYDDSEKIK